MIKPKTPEEVVAFIGSNYNSMIPTAEPVMNESGKWVTGELLPLEDIVYSLTVHDLLRAFSEQSPHNDYPTFYAAMEEMKRAKRLSVMAIESIDSAIKNLECE